MKDYIILGHENPDVDSIVSGYLLNILMKQMGYHTKFIIPDKTIDEDTYNICIKYGLNVEEFMNDIPNDFKGKYILVDHNEDVRVNDVTLVVDHHPRASQVDTDKYSLGYYNEIASSTACLIAEDNESYFNKDELTLAIIATVIDTVSFHSDKTRNKDVSWVKDMCQKLNLNYQELLSVGLMLTDMKNLEKSAFNGLKKYNFNGTKIESSYIQIEKSKTKEKEIEKIIDILKEYCSDNDIDIFVFIVSDMTKFKTTVYKIKENNIEVKKYNKFTSRGSTIIPEIEKEINSEKKKVLHKN